MATRLARKRGSKLTMSEKIGNGRFKVRQGAYLPKAQPVLAPLYVVGVCLNRIGTEQTIGKLKSQDQMCCPGCGISINIDTSKLSNAVEEIRNAIEHAPPEITIKFFR